jgi:chromosomal replication initiation ATPase DnaA
MIEKPHSINSLTYLGLDVKTKIGVMRVLSTVCSHFKITVDQVQSTTRKSEVVEARHYFCFIASTCFDYFTLSFIGQAINKDHSTVLNARKKIYNYLDTEAKTGRIIEEIKYQLNQFTSDDIENKQLGPNNIGWYNTPERKRKLKEIYK